MEELAQEYKETRKTINKSYESLKQIRDSKRAEWSKLKEDKLKLMAKLTLPTTWEAEREQLELEIAELESNMKLIGEMRSGVEYIIEWLETGTRPGNKRGIERRAAYQREKPVDPLIMQSYLSKTSSGSNIQVSDRDRDRIEFALEQLSPRERECYEMIRGNGLTYAEVSKLLDIERSSVQSYIDAADKKLRIHINQADLFDYLEI